MIDFNTFTKIAKECGRFGQINCCQGVKTLPKVQKITQSGHTKRDPLCIIRLVHFTVSKYSSSPRARASLGKLEKEVPQRVSSVLALAFVFEILTLEF